MNLDKLAWIEDFNRRCDQSAARNRRWEWINFDPGV